MISIVFTLGLLMLAIGFIQIGKEEKQKNPKMLYHIPWYCIAVVLIVLIFVILSKELLNET